MKKKQSLQSVNSIIFHDIRNEKYTDAVKNGCLATVFLTLCFKNYVLLRHANSLKKCIEIIDKDYAEVEQYTQEEKKIIQLYSKKGSNVCWYWFLAICSTGAMFPIKALLFMISSLIQGDFKLVPMFDMTYPAPIETHKEIIYVYFILFLYCFIFDMYAMSVYVGFDPLPSIFLLHVCGQIEILSMRMKNVMANVKDHKEICEKLKKINQKLQAIYVFHNSVQSNFLELLEFNMKTTILLLPFSAFQIVQSLKHLELNIEFICFFGSYVIHFLIPCYYSNLLMEKSNELREAIYSCGWENQPNIQIRKTVLFMLARCGIPLSMRTIFHPVNLATFAEVCRQAYTIFNIMNAAWS
ncbi:PREDICTED: odorant receptor 10a-like [Papilio polytes]|uniref:odorant receptor 10a-like n=1 Tax=Papilio polytes TaxID=76194 RepID=UPI0006767046|nr:PREDICTED: odorant receptor 10a-like [Papilio polytes]